MQSKSFHSLKVNHYFYFLDDFVHGKADRRLPNVYKKESFHTVRQFGAVDRFVFKANIQVEDIGEGLPLCAPSFPEEVN